MELNFLENKPYYIEFLDHCVGTSTDKKNAMKISAVGWCVAVHKEIVHFTSWNVITEDEDLKNNNMETFTILRAVILKKRLLKGVPDRCF